MAAMGLAFQSRAAVKPDLRVGFYDATCPKAESIVRQVVENRFRTDPSITPALLRMHFHDCFVRGCDASILIDSTQANSAEKEAVPNQTVRGYELIDEAKKNLEVACPSTVSCADIITMATRDSVALAGGPNYTVPTGRRDGLVSNEGDVNLPSPRFTVPQALRSFSDKGLTLNDMVTLLGAHTVGFAHCSFFRSRLSSSGRPDPTMDPALDATLSKLCGPADSNPRAFLDQNTSLVFDNQYYHQVMLNRGVLHIDQQLSLDKSSAPMVSNFAKNGAVFQQSFANAMVKMGSIQVVVGTDGEIRKNCRAFN
ncbi:peroxidase 44 [Daucus carota subsp. sativus]|uniref:Peroxidase n=1 Tax=Daucus carota subsp. sativus TaxID=79200 RepID=A0A164WWD4_DAUCS